MLADSLANDAVNQKELILTLVIVCEEYYGDSPYNNPL